MILKSYKYRIYPNKEQKEILNQNFGSVRFVWNKLVANFNSYSKDGPNMPMSEKILKDNPEYSWLKSSISYALQQKRLDFDETKKQIFSKTRKTKLGRMKFKSKGISNDSFRIPGQALGFNKCINFDTNRIKLPKLDSIKIVIDRRFNGNLKSVTVSKNKCNQYFVSVLVEEILEPKQNTGKSIGIDLGLKDLMILSNGTRISNPKWFRETQSKLKKSQQHLSRKIKGSNRYKRQRFKVARIHLDIRNQRNYINHNLSTWLVENYSTIITETLKVKNMVKNRKLSKSIADASWYSLVSMIQYKAVWNNRIFHKIDTFYPSSKTCSCCGNKVVSLPLSVRTWDCSSCGTNHDRDINAATNILNRGLKDLYSFTSDELADYRRGEELSPMMIYPKASSVKRLVYSL